MLEFNARCTASGHGYACVAGGSNGNLAVVKVAENAVTSSRAPNMPELPSQSMASNVKYDNVGQDIINSITIHKSQTPGYDDDVVAVLSNNDHTVRIYSLKHKEEVRCLDFPFAMNHAIISPDGNWMVAVGDQEDAYFFKRAETQKPRTRGAPMTRASPAPQEWLLSAEVPLHAPRANHHADYFCAAWAPSSRLCAMASECGYITVLDTALLQLLPRDDDAIVTVIKSTRPGIGSGPGSVRTMQFSPSPWDLLIWSEDQARVCVADLRSGLKRKQVLTLDAHSPAVERVEMSDVESDLDVLRDVASRRVRSQLDEDDLAIVRNWASNYRERSAAGRQRSRRLLGVVESDNDPHALTPQEQQILLALGTTQASNDERERTERPVNARNTDTTSTAATDGGPWAPDLDSLRRVLGQMDRERSPSPFSANLRELISDRRSGERVPFQPRRQVSVMGSRDATGTGPRGTGTVGTDTQLAATTWVGGPNIMDSGLTRSPNPLPATQRRSENVLRQLYRETVRDGPRVGGPRRLHTGFDTTLGARTTGIAISDNGHKLYCATEEGLFVFLINTRERMSFAALVPQ